MSTSCFATKKLIVKTGKELKNSEIITHSEKGSDLHIRSFSLETIGFPNTTIFSFQFLINIILIRFILISYFSASYKSNINLISNIIIVNN